MKPERAFIADRTAAQHCEELLRGKGGQAGGVGSDLAQALARALPHLEVALARGLAGLNGGDAPRVSCEPVQEMTHAELAAQLPPLAGICALAAGPHSSPLLAIFDAGAVFGHVDRAFGGQGVSPDPMPEAFPLSAELMLGRLEEVLGQAAIHALATTHSRALRPMARGGRMALVSPLDDGDVLHVLRMTVIEESSDPWRVMLAMPGPALSALMAEEAGDLTPLPPDARPPADPLAEPFGAMPLTLVATLVDMAVPFSTIARLRPGDVLPVAVARSVPISIGGQTMAHGIIGECDDKVAVRLTQTF